jgi:hypothetical protein
LQTFSKNDGLNIELKNSEIWTGGGKLASMNNSNSIKSGQIGGF